MASISPDIDENTVCEFEKALGLRGNMARTLEEVVLMS